MVPSTWSSYEYVDSDPVGKTDRTGLMPSYECWDSYWTTGGIGTDGTEGGPGSGTLVLAGCGWVDDYRGDDPDDPHGSHPNSGGGGGTPPRTGPRPPVGAPD